MSGVTCQVSCVTCHVSCVACHVSDITFFSSFSQTKWLSLLVEGLLLTGPNPSSLHMIKLFYGPLFPPLTRAPPVLDTRGVTFVLTYKNIQLKTTLKHSNNYYRTTLKIPLKYPITFGKNSTTPKSSVMFKRRPKKTKNLDSG